MHCYELLRDMNAALENEDGPEVAGLVMDNIPLIMAALRVCAARADLYSEDPALTGVARVRAFDEAVDALEEEES